MIKSITILLIFVTMKKGVKPPIILPYSKSLNIQKLRNSIAQKENNIHLKGLYAVSYTHLTLPTKA